VSAVEEAKRCLLRTNSTPSDMTPTSRQRHGLSQRDRQLLNAVPFCIDATSPDNVVVTPQPAIMKKNSQFYSPSNYTEAHTKPDKDKKFESPFHKLRRKSSKRLLHHVLTLL